MAFIREHPLLELYGLQIHLFFSFPHNVSFAVTEKRKKTQQNNKTSRFASLPGEGASSQLSQKCSALHKINTAAHTYTDGDFAIHNVRPQRST